MSRVDTLAALVGLSMEVGCLKDLAGWPPVGAVLEEIPAVLSGNGQLSQGQVTMLRRWAGRWRALSPALRAFYAAEAADPTQDPGVVEAALWRILEGAGRPPLTGRQYGALRARWADRYGYAPAMDLAPLPTVDTVTSSGLPSVRAEEDPST